MTWACQWGYFPGTVQRFFPWRWVLEPFTIYGAGWTCRWFPTAFDIVGHMVFWSGFRRWEKETAPVILEQIRAARCFLDIGANCGIYSVLGCVVNPTVRVVAVEPVPRIFAALANNVKQNHVDGRVIVLNIALGDRDGIVDFHESENPSMGSLAVEGYQGTAGNIIQVQCRTLDSIVKELNIEPDFIKIDVEGFEHVVLSGASDVLSRFHPRMVLEANPGDASDRVTEILSRYGYQFHILTDSGPERRNQIIPERDYRNWLCLPGD
jgi:FkbM family methyltransferase